MIENKLIGLDEVSSEVNSNCDVSLRNEYIAHFTHLFKCKAARVWLLTKEVIKIKPNDEIEFIPEGLIKFHNYIESLRKAGIEKFVLLDWGFVYPYGYKATDAWVVPDPKTEPESYRRFMLLQQKVRYEIANNFTFIQYFESTNEPDGPGGTFLHKNNYKFNSGDNEHVFTRDEIEDIILDLNYFENLGVKEAYKNNVMLLPSFCNFDYGPEYLDSIYTKIKSGKYPTIGNIKSNKIESFFEILNFHPYNLVSVEINKDWLDSQKNLREVMLKHNDENRKVWYTEIGWTDFRRVNEKDNVAQRYLDFFKAVEELPWVEAIFLFRLFNLSNRPENEGEDNFGLIYNEHDWKSPLCPKPAAISIYKYLHGKNASLDPLYKFALNGREQPLFPYTVINKNKDAFKVLILGNHITYQTKAPWNNLNEDRGLSASKASNDYAHLLLEKLKERYQEVEMTLVDLREWETTFYYYELFKDLEKFKNNKPDLVIVRLGENVFNTTLKDHDYSKHFAKLCKHFKTDDNQIIVTNTIKGKREVDEQQKKVADENSYDFVDFSELSLNYSCLEKGNYINNEYKYLPNDEGMKIISELIFAKIK